MDDNWVMLLFTSCTLLILKCLLVGCMGTCEEDAKEIKNLVEIPTHTPLYFNEEEVEGFGL